MPELFQVVPVIKVILKSLGSKGGRLMASKGHVNWKGKRAERAVDKVNGKSFD